MASATAPTVRADQSKFRNKVRLRNDAYNVDSLWKESHGLSPFQEPSSSINYLLEQIVPQASAVVPGTTDGESIAIPADHVNLVKFSSRQDVGYRKVSEYLQVMTENASVVIRAQWDDQDRIENGTLLCLLMQSVLMVITRSLT
jgi:hypothetical protein